MKTNLVSFAGFLVALIIGVSAVAQGTCPPNQVQLKVNGAQVIDAVPGQNLTYFWSTSGTRRVWSYYTADRGDRCSGGITDADIRNGVFKPWAVNIPNETKQLTAQVQSCQSGVSYLITVMAELFDGSVQSAHIKVRIR